MRLIDADALTKDTYIKEGDRTVGRRLFVTFAEIDDAPTIDAEPVRHGKNIDYTEKYHCEFKCSLCGATADIVEGGSLDGGYFNYCPNCGAKMDGEIRPGRGRRTDG